MSLNGTPMAAGQWHQIAMVFNGTRLQIFQDGCQTAVTTFPSTTLKAGTVSLIVGAHIPGFTCCNFPFHGQIDELKFYNVALAGTDLPAPPPATLHCPNDVDVTVPCSSVSYGGNTGTASVSGNCPNCPYTVVSDHSGQFPIGTTIVTFTATNSCGAPTLTCTQRVTVSHAPVPTLTVTCPADMTGTTAPGQCSAIVNPGTATASGGCGSSTLSGTRSDGRPLTDPYPKGVTTITWTATDTSGNSASCTQSITVHDAEAPTITSATANPAVLWPPNHCLVPVCITVNASDNCDASVTSKIIAVTSSEPVTGKGFGKTTPDWIVTGDLCVKLRAERYTKKIGRTYVLTVQVTDSSGNVSTKQVTVTVPRKNPNRHNDRNKDRDEDDHDDCEKHEDGGCDRDGDREHDNGDSHGRYNGNSHGRD